MVFFRTGEYRIHNGYKTGVRCFNGIYLVVSFFFNFHPDFVGFHDPIWRLHIFQRGGGSNHQLGMWMMFEISLKSWKSGPPRRVLPKLGMWRRPSHRAMASMDSGGLKGEGIGCERLRWGETSANLQSESGSNIGFKFWSVACAW